MNHPKLPLTVALIAALILGTGFDVAAHGTRLSQPRDSVKLNKLIKQIARENTYQLKSQGSNAQEQVYRRFAQSASTFEFLKIAMENKAPMVRLFAFKAIAERMDDLPDALVVKFKTDTTPIKMLEGNEVTEVPLYRIANGFLK